MKLIKPVTAVAFAIALGAGGILASPAYAELPKAPSRISVIDTNKNGKIEKSEYLAFMSSAFDKAAGAKGYCTYEEVQAGFEDMRKNFYIN